MHPCARSRASSWPVTARTQVPHVRETIADRELETWAVIDLSASLDFGTANCQKRDLAIAGLAVGPHQLVLTKSGFIDSHHAVWLGAGEDKSVRVTLIPTSVDAGSVSVVSAPSGADVRIDARAGVAHSDH